MNSPGRMFWEPSEYFRSESFGFLSFLNFFAKPFLALPLSILRMGDFVAAQRVDHFVANSKTPQKRIKKYYKRESKVIYPFVNYKKYINVQPHTGAYYVILTRLVSWKRVGVAIRACNKLKVPLKIIGDGPDLERLKKMSGNNIEFLGHVSDQQMIDVLSGCKALIVTQHEDFGIAPLDAMACGKPVVAYAKGGALETVAPGITGEFYYKQDESSLSDLLVNFDPSRYSPNNCKNRAKKFDKPVFEKSIKDYICNILINGEKC